MRNSSTPAGSVVSVRGVRVRLLVWLRIYRCSAFSSSVAENSWFGHSSRHLSPLGVGLYELRAVLQSVCCIALILICEAAAAERSRPGYHSSNVRELCFREKVARVIGQFGAVV